MTPSPVHKTNYAAEALSLLTSRYQKARPPAAPPPSVTTIVPALGDASGGVPVTITGTNFTGATNVTIGGGGCSSIVIVNPTTITCVTPAVAASAAAKDVIVTGPGGSGALAASYTSFWPTVLTSATLRGWWRADLGVTFGTGTQVSALADQSGAGDVNRNLTQAVGSHQPTQNATDAAYNNRATLTHDRALTQYLQSGTWSVAPVQPCTVWVVGNDDGSALNQTYVDGAAEYANLIDTNDGYNVGIYAGVSLNSGAALSASPRILGGFFNGASSKTYVSARTATATGNAGTSNATGITIGAAHGASGPLSGKIAEAVVFSGTLSTQDVANLLQYLGQRYAITVGA